MKPIFLDIDGTLLNSRLEVTPRTKAALKAAHDRDYRIVLCSGRAVTGLTDVTRQLPFPVMFATLNGAYITDEERKVLYSASFSERDVNSICSLIKENNLDYMYFYGEKWGVEKENFLYDFEASIVKTAGAKEEVSSIAAKYQINKLLSFGKPEESLLFYEKAKKKFPSFEIFPSSPEYIEINTPGVTKGAAVKIVSEYLGSDIKEALAFGDYNNDISMFHSGCKAIAMGNAVPELKAIADSVTLSNDEDGIAVYLEENIL